MEPTEDDWITASVRKEPANALNALQYELYVHARVQELREVLQTLPPDHPPITTLADIEREQAKKQIALRKELEDALHAASNITSNCNQACPKCGKRNALCKARQVRSGDEAQTLFYLCLSCQNKWKR